MITTRLATSRDMDAILDFINMVFSMVHEPHNFATLIPKVYGPQTRHADIHVIAEEDGVIVGCVGLHVFPLRVCGEVLRVGYVGSVSAHPRLRGQGIMRRVMEAQLARAGELGLDLLALGGQRQRYEFYGFTPAGSVYTYRVRTGNVRHALAQVDASAIAFRAMEEGDAAQMFALYDAQVVAGARTAEDFLLVLRSFNGVPHVVEQGGRAVGYLVASSGGGVITELVLEDGVQVQAVIKAFIQGRDGVAVKAGPHDLAIHRALAGIADGFSLGNCCRLRVLNAQKVAHAYMKMAAKLQPLADGEVRLNVDGETFVLRAEGGEGCAAPATQADAQLTAMDAQRLLYAANRFDVPDAAVQAPAGWFPLPFYLPEADTF